MPAPVASELAQLHATALEAAAAFTDTSSKVVRQAFRVAATADFTSYVGTLAARQAAFSVALMAVAGLRCKRGSLAAALEVENQPDAMLRDSAYRVHRMGQTPAEVAAAQGVREITVRQNLRRLERSVQPGVLAQLVLMGAEPVLTQEEVEQALAKPKKSKAEGRIVTAFACAAWQEAMETILGIGVRSVRGIRGRPWIEPTTPRRPAGLMVAEEGEAYGNVRSFDVRNDSQGWATRIAVSPKQTAIALVTGAGIAVMNQQGQMLGTITPEAPSLALPGITLPAELHLRKLGPAS